tara:strand:- start:1356 stop:2387 length:1032 start_codon:yes stop_codon:yes gene_type:complete
MSEKYASKGLTGLANLGNTCFINSCMQVISHTYELSDILDDDNLKMHMQKNDDSVVLNEWNKLRKLMWSSNCTISPNGWLRAIHTIAQKKDKDIFTGFAQNDLPEFLLFITDCFHNSIKREVDMSIKGDVLNEKDMLAKKCYDMMITMYKKEYSEILKLFFGLHVSQISSLDGEILNNHPEPFYILDLPIPNANPKKSYTITQCLDIYCEPEKLHGENAWFNEKTGNKQDVNRRILFWSLPDIVTITFKRFNNSGRKLQNMINFPIEDLDLTPYTHLQDNSFIYDLYGICNHSGGTAGGHYTSCVKNANNKWYYFNDTNVSEIKDPSKMITSQAYCLFYRKKK